MTPGPGSWLVASGVGSSTAGPPSATAHGSSGSARYPVRRPARPSRPAEETPAAPVPGRPPCGGTIGAIGIAALASARVEVPPAEPVDMWPGELRADVDTSGVDARAPIVPPGASTAPN